MQFSSDYLDLAIGLAAVFFLASLVVSALADGIQWPLRVRSKFLWAYLHDLTSVQRVHLLPRGKRGIVSLWGKRNDERPCTGNGEPAGELPTTAAITAEAGGLQQLARALDPIDAPQLTRPTKRSVGTPASGEPAPKRQRRTSIQSIPPRSLAQGFLEVFAEAGRIPLDSAMRAFAAAHAAGDQAAIATTSAALGELLVPTGAVPSATGTATASSLTTAFETYATAVRDATDRDGLRTAGAALATGLRTLPGVEGHHDLVADATKLAHALRPELLDPRALESDQQDPAEVRAEAARWLVSGIMRSLPGRFSRQRIDIALDELGDSPLGITARRLWDGAERDIDEFRTSLERYFDSEMSRLSGYYKRSIRIVLIVLAVVVALVGNIDAIAVTEGLWRNPDGRSALIAQADDLARSEPTDPGGGADGEAGAGEETTAPTLALLQQRCRELASSDGGDDPDPAAVAAGLQEVRACVDDALTELSGLGVIDQALWASPSGWFDDYVPFYRSDDEQGGDWALHALGVALTAAALVLGSSFWFDLIKRLTGLRRGLVGQT